MSDIEISTIKLTELNPSDNAVRTIDEEGLKILEKSMENFGLVEPIVINIKNNANRIISGHQRYDVLLNKYMDDEIEDEDLNLIKLGDFGWVFRETNLKLDNDDAETELSIAMNTHQGKFIKSKLEETLKELKLKGLDTELTGFSNLELKKMNVSLSDKISEDKSEDKKESKESFGPKIITCPSCGHEFESQ